MNKYALMLATVIFSGWAIQSYPQDKPKEVKPLVVPDFLVRKIQTAQVEALATKLEMDQLEKQYQADQQKFADDQDKLANYTKEAYAALKIKQEDYDIDFKTTFEATPKKKPATPEAAPPNEKPTPKAEEKK